MSQEIQSEPEIEITRRMVIHLKNEATGSPRLRKRVVHARVALRKVANEPIGKEDVNLEFNLVKAEISRFVSINAELMPSTVLERMVFLARWMLLRPHAERKIDITWKVAKRVESGTYYVKGISVKLSQDYDPPLEALFEVQSGTWHIDVDFKGRKRESRYTRSFSPGGVDFAWFNPIDVHVAKLAYAVLTLANTIYSVWSVIGNNAMKIRFDGKEYILDVLYDSDLLQEQEPQEQSGSEQIQNAENNVAVANTENAQQ